MKWFYNKDKQGVIAEQQPEGYHYDFRGKDLSRTAVRDKEEPETEEKKELAEIKEQYKKKFGRKPHGLLKKENILKAIANAC